MDSLPGAGSISGFEARLGWRDLPHDYLVVMAPHLLSTDNTAAFMATCERLDLFPEPLTTLVTREAPPKALVATAQALTGRANSLAEQRDFSKAHCALQAALLLQPRHLPTWISMAALAYSMGDCAMAVEWARRVLEFRPRPASDDPCEEFNVAILTQSGQAGAPNILGIGSLWPVPDIRAFMAHIREGCAEGPGPSAAA
jgi:hypothetical protein